MTASRTSNKQILDAILGLTEAIKGSQVNQASPEPPVLTDVVTPLGVTQAPERTSDATQINVPKSYLEHVTAKVGAKASEAGKPYMLYARKNLAGETKLAYCLTERWSALKDRGLIGPIQVVQPE